MGNISEMLIKEEQRREVLLRQGKVISIQTGPPRTCTVLVGATNFVGITVADHVDPTVNEGVWIADMGRGRWIIIATNSATQTRAQYVKVPGDTMTGPLLLPDGTLANAALSFAGDPNTGIIHTGADGLALTTGGTSRLTIDNGGVVRIPAMAEFSILRSDAAVAARKTNDATVAPMYATSFYEDALGADQTFTFVAAGSEVTMVSRSVVTTRANAKITIEGMIEANVSVAGTGVGVMAAKVGATWSAYNGNFPTNVVNARLSISKKWFFTIASPGTTTVLVAIRKTVNDGTIQARATNSLMLTRVDE